MLRSEQVSLIKSQTGLDDAALAFALLPLAAACSVAPISKFYVGAVARGVSGNLYFGANMEFRGASMQQTVHAEQSAVTHAGCAEKNGWSRSPLITPLAATVASL